jgi:hypothetical protein
MCVLVLLCLWLWAWSVSHGPHLTYTSTSTTYGIGTAWGTVGLGYAPATTGWWGNSAPGLDWGQYAMDESHFWPPNFISYSLGFRLQFSGGSSECQLNIPYWFITLLLAGLTCYSWRKTGRHKSPRAFPVTSDVSNQPPLPRS